jgi:N-acetylmuramate 1-kinase
MAHAPLVLSLADERATVRLGQDLAAAVRPGDVVALSGDLGTGKTTLARALVRALAADPLLDVPSPTFTLVQSYDTSVPVHHFDLYRLTAPEDFDELGFDALASQSAVTLVEWPERTDRLPADAIRLELDHAGHGRRATIAAPPAAHGRIARALAARSFLDGAGAVDADRSHLAGDASARSYQRITVAGLPTRILMDSPPLVLGPPVKDGLAYAEIAHTARSVHAFVAIAALLHSRSVSVPEIYACDVDRGLVLLEDLGTESIVSAAGEPIVERYRMAAELLADLHAEAWPTRAAAGPVVHPIPPFDRAAMLIEAELMLDWYLPGVLGREASPGERQAFAAAWNAVLDRLAGQPYGFMHRDFQSTNLIWRGERAGLKRIAVIDFQDALIGPTAYDLASLALDARVTMTPELEAATVDAYRARRSGAGGFDADGFAMAYAIMAAQRKTKLLGIFVRLHRRDGKPQYLAHLPRIRDYLRRVLVHPALAPVATL